MSFPKIFIILPIYLENLQSICKNSRQMPKIDRITYFKKIKDLLRKFPVVALVGSRQSGKTTLANQIKASWEGPVHYFDLENSQDMERMEDPLLTLGQLQGLIIIDEVQHKKNLFMLLRVLADRDPLPARFLLLGSASGHLLHQSSESLAGRIAYLELHGFGLWEIGSENREKLWLRGAYPKSFLAESDDDSFEWRDAYIKTFFGKDLPELGVKVMGAQLRRFWFMASHYHGQIWNHSEIARSLGVSVNTIRNYLDLLTETFMVRQLMPWYENIGKRVVKAPKFYFRDSGLLHTLLNLRNKEELLNNPKLGASWEGYALEQVIQASGRGDEVFFWSTYSGSEVDLVMLLNGKKIGFEFKYASVPKKTTSMVTSKRDLELAHIYVVYPEGPRYLISDNIEALSLADMIAELRI